MWGVGVSRTGKSVDPVKHPDRGIAVDFSAGKLKLVRWLQFTSVIGLKDQYPVRCGQAESAEESDYPGCYFLVSIWRIGNDDVKGHAFTGQMLKSLDGIYL